MNVYYVKLDTLTWSPDSVYDRAHGHDPCIVRIEADSRGHAVKKLRDLLQRLLDESAPPVRSEESKP